jgi:hypothetical protein
MLQGVCRMAQEDAGVKVRIRLFARECESYNCSSHALDVGLPQSHIPNFLTGSRGGAEEGRYR